MPAHVAIIMDGNGRWAKGRALPRPLGHHAGMRSVREVVQGCLDAEVGVLSLFAFSQENWQRPAVEIGALMSLLEEYIARELDRPPVQRRGGADPGRHRAPGAERPAGRVSGDGGDGRRRPARAQPLHLVQLARGDRPGGAAAGRGRRGRPAATRGAIDEDAFARRLYTAPWPDPDLLIRTSGEMRISNFLLWQLAYAELYVTPVLWPDFTRRHLFEAILEFQRRDRRFGRVSV